MSEDFDPKVKRRKKAGDPITVVEVVYTPTSDADRRMAAAINLLLSFGSVLSNFNSI